VNLEDIADTVVEYWYDAIWYDMYNDDIDYAIDCALADTKSEQRTAETHRKQLDSLYDKLRRVPKGLEDDREIQDICDAVKNMYSAYTKYYDFAMEPSGSYNSYTADKSTKTDDFLNCYKKLLNLVG